MASTFSTNLAIELIGTGDQAGTWGTTTNSNLGTLIEQAISGYVTQAVATGTDTTITIPNGSTGVARNMYIELTGTGGASTNLIVPANKKLYFIFNNSTGAVTVKVSGQTGVSVPTGKKMVLVSNGTDIVNGLNYIADFGTNSFTVTNLTASSATITNLIATSGSITNLVSSDASATVLRAGSATLTHLSATSVSITNVSVASATVSSNLTLSGGTANGVAFLNASKVVTAGSALTFDGTQTFNLFATGNAVTNLEGSATNNAILRFRNGTTGALAGFYGNNSKELIFEANGTTEQMRLTSTGLGIGTASPAVKLEVLRGSEGEYLRAGGDDTGNNGRGLRFTSSTNGGFIGAKHTLNAPSAGGAIAFSTASTERAVIDSSGNLGIGTASPAYKLHVERPSYGVTGYFFTNDGTRNPRLVIYGSADGTTLQHTYSTGAGSLIFANGGAIGAGNEVGRFDASGNLGIGTASPANRLDVLTGVEGDSVVLNNNNSNVGAANTFGYIVKEAGSNRITLRYRRDGSATSELIGVSAGPFVFGTSNTERMRLDASGNLGLGVTPSAWFGNSKVIQFGSGGSLEGRSNLPNLVQLSANAYIDSSGNTRYLNTAAASSYLQYLGAHSWYTAASGTAGNAISFTQAMTLDASGNLLVGTTSAGAGISGVTSRMAVVAAAANFGGVFVTDSTAYHDLLCWNKGTSSDNAFIEFATEASYTARGSITYNRAGGLVAYNVTSDYRAKDILGPVQNSGAIIDALKVYEGQMKGASQSRPMLVAHEAQEHAPYTVTGEKDAVNEDGTPKYQQMDVSALVPLLLAELQSLRKRVAELESK
jgi:hypothetical protein